MERCCGAGQAGQAGTCAHGPGDRQVAPCVAGPPEGCGCTRRSSTVLSGRLSGLYASQHWSTGPDSSAAGLAGLRRSMLPSRLVLLLAAALPLPSRPPLPARPRLPLLLLALPAMLGADPEGCMPPPWLLPPPFTGPASPSSRSLLLEGWTVVAVWPVASTLGQSGNACRGRAHMARRQAPAWKRTLLASQLPAGSRVHGGDQHCAGRDGAHGAAPTLRKYKLVTPSSMGSPLAALGGSPPARRAKAGSWMVKYGRQSRL